MLKGRHKKKERRRRMQAHGIGDGLLYKSQAGKKQPRWQTQLNKLLSKIRCRIEGIFGIMKTSMGLTRSRYKGWDKHQVQFDRMAMDYNLKRATKLLKAF
ncbi:transposase [Alphaproteobacteria bacterium]|nr:transposase [Alphaproteobacteria bacterium]